MTEEATDKPPTFGTVLRRLRDAAGLTQEELAASAGVGVRTVSDLERGVAQTARKATAARLAHALGLDAEQTSRFLDVARGRRTPASPVPVERLGVATLHTLPRDVTTFTGRRSELDEVLAAARDRERATGVYAIGGMAGVGKTAFALRAAHELASEFPDGQLFVDLHGHTAGQDPVHPRDALGNLLLAAGVSVAQVPGGLEARAAMWRHWLHDKRVLLVLDDAVDSEQVQPLLPGTAKSLVLITSRRRLALEHTATTSLEVLPLEEAARLLIRLADRPDVNESTPQLLDLVHRCGALPLAIGLLARRLHHHRAWSVADLAAELEVVRGRLELLTAERTSVSATFELSYGDLADEERRTFRRLGAHPGGEVDAHSVAALAGVGLDEARRHLDTLYDNHLLIEVRRGRFRLHDLLREFTRDCCDAAGPTERRDSIAGLIDYYIAAGWEAQRLLHWRPAVAVPATSSRVPLPQMVGAAEWLQWCHEERSNLLACLDEVTSERDATRIVALTAAVRVVLDRVSPRDDAVQRYGAAVSAARDLGSDEAIGSALNDLGDALYHAGGDYRSARDVLREAAHHFDSCGDRLGEANVLVSLGVVHRLLADYPEATRCEERAADVYRELDESQGEARALLELGGVLCDVSEFAHATTVLEQAFERYEQLGDVSGRAIVLSDLGFVRESVGDLEGAAVALRNALPMFIELHDRQGEANTRRYLGHVERLSGNLEAAASELDQSLELYSRLGEQHGRSSVLCERGALRRVQGDYEAARSDLLEALRIGRELGNQRSEVDALNEQGFLCAEEARWGDARLCYLNALEMARAIGSKASEGDALAGLSRCARAEGCPDEASTLLRQARDLFERLGVHASEHLTASENARETAGNGSPITERS